VLDKIFKIDPNKLSEILELIKKIGIYTALKNILKQPMFRNAIKSKLSEIGKSIISKYEITAYNISIKKTNEGCKVIVRLSIPDPELRKEFLDRLHDTVKKILTAKEISIVQPFMNEFKIKNISAKESGEEVIVSFTGNEKLYDLIKDVGGDLVEESEESR